MLKKIQITTESPTARMLRNAITFGNRQYTIQCQSKKTESAN